MTDLFLTTKKPELLVMRIGTVIFDLLFTSKVYFNLYVESNIHSSPCI
jgi:hypothetical protein